MTVEVQNGTQSNGWAKLAASRLNYAGYATTISNADRQNYTNSVLIDYTSSQDANAHNTILTALGLTNSATILSAPEPNSTTQYRLIVGYDYLPCFQPQDLSH